MEIKRGARFTDYSDDVIEYTGANLGGGAFALVFKVVGSTMLGEIGSFRLYSKEDIQRFTPQKSPAVDPLIREVLEAMEDVKFAKQLAEKCMMLWEALPDGEQDEYAKIMGDHLPEKLLETIRHAY